MIDILSEKNIYLMMKNIKKTALNLFYSTYDNSTSYVFSIVIILLYFNNNEFHNIFFHAGRTSGKTDSFSLYNLVKRLKLKLPAHCLHIIGS